MRIDQSSAFAVLALVTWLAMVPSAPATPASVVPPMTAQLWAFASDEHDEICCALLGVTGTRGVALKHPPRHDATKRTKSALTSAPPAYPEAAALDLSRRQL